MTKSKKTAFSLLEISLIILIISAVISGIVKGNDLYKSSRLSTAKSLTQQSVVIDIPNLTVWYETALETSFIADETQDDGYSISTWYDNNPQAPAKNHALQTATANKPKFYTETFNSGIPGIRFDGNDFMTFLNDSLINTGYTIFVVEQRRSNTPNNYFLGGTTSTANQNIGLGYSTDTNLTYSHFTDSINQPIPAYSSNEPRMHTFFFNQDPTSGGKKYWLNGGLTPETANATQTDPITDFTGSAIGRYLTNYYDGDIGEIIIFNRNLTTHERNVIEEYLGKKFSIDIE